MKKWLLLLPSILFSASVSTQAAPLCSKILFVHSVRHEEAEAFLKQTKDAKPELRFLIETMQSTEAIDTDLILGLKTPTWSDFAFLEAMKVAYKYSLTDLTGPQKKSAEDFYQQLDVIWEKENRQRKVVKISRNETESYGPVDFGLRLAYQAKLAELNQYLPSQARYPEVELAPDLQKNQNYQDAITVVKSLVRKHDYQMKKAGFFSHKEFVQALEAGSEKSRKALQVLVEDRELEFAMARPSQGRFWIEKVGFHNQHVTGSTKGYLGNQGRNAVEASYLNLKTDNYADRNNDFKPKYGYLFPRIGGPFQGKQVFYGDDLYIFKKGEIKDRVTFTIGDSLNAMREMGKYNWQQGVSYKANHWDQVFTPWTRREVLAPILKEDLFPGAGGKGTLRVESNFPDPSYEIGLGKKFERSHGRDEYVELQYWGPLGLDNVKAFMFRSMPPTGSFLKALRQRGITIYDARTSPVKIWKDDLLKSKQ